MDFRRSSHSDERRRRVLIDDAGQHLAEALPAPRRADGAGRAAAEPAKTYLEAALSSRQRRVVDLIPTRRWTLLLLLLLAVCAATALEALYGCVALGYTPLCIDQVPAVDLARSGNIADWFSSCLLLAAAGLGVLTYLIRRHRVDDYRGRYRMWYWVVPLLVLASLEQVADLFGSLRAALLVLAGIPHYADAALIWSAVLGVVATAVTVRLTLEMRGCRLAMLSLAAGLACYGLRQAAELNWILATPSVLRVMATAGLVLLGNICVLLALSLFARYVYRDARGEIVRKPRAARPEKQPRRRQRSSSAASRGDAAAAPARAVTASSGSGTKIRVDQPHAPAASATPAATAPRAAAPIAAAPAKPERTRGAAESSPARSTAARSSAAAVATARPAAQPAEHAELDEEDGGDNLSRAERRRLRKLQRREKRQA